MRLTAVRAAIWLARIGELVGVVSLVTEMLSVPYLVCMSMERF